MNECCVWTYANVHRDAQVGAQLKWNHIRMGNESKEELLTHQSSGERWHGRSLHHTWDLNLLPKQVAFNKKWIFWLVQNKTCSSIPFYWITLIRTLSNCQPPIGRMLARYPGNMFCPVNVESKLPLICIRRVYIIYVAMHCTCSALVSPRYYWLSPKGMLRSAVNDS